MNAKSADLVVRLASDSDADGLHTLANQAKVDLTTVSKDPDFWPGRIDQSQQGIAPLFVLVSVDSHGRDVEILGTSGIHRRVGDSQEDIPFYAFRIEKSVHRSAKLDVHHVIDTLHLVRIYDGPTELGSLFVHPKLRGRGAGKLLSLSRFLMMANAPNSFHHHVICEFRGYLDDQGRSPFWEAIGRHFFHVDFLTADARSAIDKRFIAELMPPHPIYVPLLPTDAQNAIGCIHPLTRPAKRLLTGQGFRFEGMVDIFDGGPCYGMDLAAADSIRGSLVVRFEEKSGWDLRRHQRNPLLIATTDGTFRCIASYGILHDTHVEIESLAVRQLKLARDARVRVYPQPQRNNGNSPTANSIDG